MLRKDEEGCAILFQGCFGCIFFIIRLVAVSMMIYGMYLGILYLRSFL